VLKAWSGKPEQVEDAKKVLLHRARMNSLACRGQYVSEEAGAAAAESLFVANHTWGKYLVWFLHILFYPQIRMPTSV